MTSKIFEVKDQLGIHVRIACEILKAVKEEECTLVCKKLGKKQEAKEIGFPIALVAMQAVFGEKVEFTVDGKGEAVALEKIAKILHCENE